MKRFFICFALITILLTSISIPAFGAGGREFVLEEAGITVTMPSDYIVFTRDLDENDPNLSRYGYTAEQMNSMMLNTSTYINAWDINRDFVIHITMFEAEFQDFNTLSDSTLSEMVSSTERSKEPTFIAFDVYHHEQTKFIRQYYTDAGIASLAHRIVYQTALGGKFYFMTMLFSSEELSDSADVIMKDVIDSIVFDADSQAAPATLRTLSEDNRIINTESQISFIVPENWMESNLVQDSEILVLTPNTPELNGTYIFYSYIDAWTTLTEAGNTELKRSDIDNSFILEFNLPSLFDLPESDARLHTFGNNEFF